MSPGNEVKVVENNLGRVVVSPVDTQRVRIHVVAEGAVDQLSTFFRTDRPADWKRDNDSGFTIVCPVKGSAADTHIKHAEYALGKCGTKPKRFTSLLSSWRRQIARIAKVTTN